MGTQVIDASLFASTDPVALKGSACADCGAHLWVICQECEAKNRRADTECTRCGRRLRKALRTHARESRWSDGRLWVGLAVIAALLAALAGLWVIFGRSQAPVAGAWAAGGALA